MAESLGEHTFARHLAALRAKPSADAEQVTGTQIPYDVVARRPGDPPALVATPKKLIEKLGWKPSYTNIVQIVHSAWKWHQSHPHGYATATGTPVRQTTNV